MNLNNTMRRATEDIFIKGLTSTIEERFGPKKRPVLMPGTGLKTALKGKEAEGGKPAIEGIIEEVREKITFKELGIAGAENEVEGHEKGIELVTINGKEWIVVGRTHANEDNSNPELPMATRQTLSALAPLAQAFVITNGAGSLTGPYQPHPKATISQEDYQAHVENQRIGPRRGYPHIEANQGDVCVIRDTFTLLAGKNNTLRAGEFISPTEHVNLDNGKHYDAAVRSVAAAQPDKDVPEIVYAYVQGPNFETDTDKAVLACNTGADAVGMSTVPELLIASKLGVPTVGLTLITNGMGLHDHEHNQDVGDENAAKIGQVIINLGEEFDQAA